MPPIAPTDNHYPLHDPITSRNPVYGFVKCEALRAMDLEAYDREGTIELVGTLDGNTLAQVIAYVLVVLGLEDL